VQVALALFPGVSADECEAFTMVFERLARDGIADVELVGVGARLGPVAGQGGGHHVDVCFSDVTAPDVVLVPGGLGVERTARDADLLAWLRAVAPSCEWMAASSTGTVVVAAAGLLGDRDAATHWLASPLLETYGSHASPERIVEVGRIITCEGRITAMHVALLVTLRVFGPDAVRRVRASLAADPTGADRPTTTVTRRQRLAAVLGRRRGAAPRRRNPELEAPAAIELEPLHHRPPDASPLDVPPSPRRPR